VFIQLLFVHTDIGSFLSARLEYIKCIFVLVLYITLGGTKPSQSPVVLDGESDRGGAFPNLLSEYSRSCFIGW